MANRSDQSFLTSYLSSVLVLIEKIRYIKSRFSHYFIHISGAIP